MPARDFNDCYLSLSVRIFKIGVCVEHEHLVKEKLRIVGVHNVVVNFSGDRMSCLSSI